MNTYQLKLDLNKGPSYSIGPAYGGITIRQGDKNGTTIEAELYDHGERLTQTGLGAYFVMPLPDREHYYRKAATYSDGTATVTIDETQAASVPGVVRNAYFELTQGTTVIASTQSFFVSILADALADKEVPEGYDTAIQDAIDALTEVTDSIPERVQAEVDAQLAAHPEWTTTVQDNSVTDAKLAPDGIKQEHAWLWGNQLTGELDGNPVTASDAHAAPMLALGVLGASEQVTTTGKNLLDRSTEETGYINSSGNPGSATDWRRSDYIPVVAGTTYTFTPNSTSGGSAYGCWYDADQGVLSTFPSGPTTQTAPTGAAYVRVSYRATSTNVQLEVGSTATAYEPYTGGKPTPRPDYPQEIRSAASPVLTVAGKNLLPNDRFCAGNYNRPAGYVFNPNASGGTLADNGDGTFALNVASAWGGLSMYTEPLPAGTYHMHIGFSGSSPRVAFGYVDASTMQYVSQTENYTSSATLDKTVTLDRPVIIVISLQSSAAGTITITQPQVNIGSTATAYEPYQGGTVTLPVTLRSLPDGTKDTLALTYLRPSTREGWAWYAGEVTRRVGRVLGSDLTRYNASNGFVAYRAVAAFAPSTSCLCSWSSVSESFNSANMTKECVQFTGLGTSSIYVAALENHSLDDFEYDYPLATPTTETLPEIELPILPSPSVTIWATADATPTLNVEYVRDAQAALTAARDDALEEIAPVESSPTKAAHTAGTYLIHDGTLYKVTRTIASGEAITVGTNVTATTIAAELLALS